jgi:uncharacterized protein YukE
MPEIDEIVKYEKMLQVARSKADQIQGRIESVKESLEELAGSSDPKKVERTLKKWEKELEEIREALREHLNAIKEVIEQRS